MQLFFRVKMERKSERKRGNLFIKALVKGRQHARNKSPKEQTKKPGRGRRVGQWSKRWWKTLQRGEGNNRQRGEYQEIAPRFHRPPLPLAVSVRLGSATLTLLSRSRGQSENPASPLTDSWNIIFGHYFRLLDRCSQFAPFLLAVPVPFQSDWVLQLQRTGGIIQ